MPADALVFDDDPFFRSMLGEVLRTLGLTVECFPDGRQALQRIRSERPGAVLLDVMMPGTDGLTLCREIKSDPDLAWIKVVIVSGKAYLEDKARADWAKADLYIEKDFGIDEFTEKLRDVLGDVKATIKPRKKASEDASPTNQPLETPVRVSQPSGPRKRWRIRFLGAGLETGCVSFVDRNRLIAIDAGDGLDALAQEKLEAGVNEVWIFLTHFHTSHIKAVAQAKNWMVPGVVLHLVGPFDRELDIDRTVQSSLPAGVQTHALREGPFNGLGDVKVEAVFTMHPGPCLAYRLEAGGTSAVFALDSEIPPTPTPGGTDNTEKLALFALNADMLVHDARYSDADYPRFAGHGHSCPKAALRLALMAGARCLVLYHLDERYSAAERKTFLADLQAAKDAGAKLSLIAIAQPALAINL